MGTGRCNDVVVLIGFRDIVPIIDVEADVVCARCDTCRQRRHHARVRVRGHVGRATGETQRCAGIDCRCRIPRRNQRFVIVRSGIVGTQIRDAQ